MYGNLTLASAPWPELFLALALGGAIIVALAAMGSRLTRSAPWQRTLWQVATLALVLLAAVELSGVGRGLSWLCRTGGSEPAQPQHGTAEAAPIPIAPSEVGQFTREVFLEPEPAWAADFSVGDWDAIGFDDSAITGASLDEAASQARIPLEYVEYAATRPSMASDTAQPNAPETRTFESSLPSDPTSAAESAQTNTANMPRRHDQGRAGSLAAPGVPSRAPDVPWWPAAIWAAGAVLLLGRMVWARLLLFVFRWRRTVRCSDDRCRALGALARRLGLRGRIHVVESEKLSLPVAFGWVRPTVAVPAEFFEEFNAREQRAMLVHELAHLAAGDPAWQAVSDLLCALIWWHPMVWWSRFRLQAASEAAADEASLLVPDGPDVLAGCLVAMGRRLSGTRRLGWVSIHGPGFRSALGRRVQRLLQLGPRKWRPPGPGRAASARLVLPVLLVLAAVFSTAWARPQEISPEGGTTMSVWQSCVGRSVAATVLWALMGPAVNEAPAEQPAPRDPAVAATAGDFDLAGLLLAQRDDEGERREGDRPRAEREGEERERGEGDRPRGDREEGEHERGEGDRPRGDRERGEGERREGDRPREEGERERGERDRPRGEGERERGERDRPRGEGERERPEGEREHPEARRNRDPEREHPEGRREREGDEREHAERERGELAEFEEHLHRMMQEREEIIGRAHQIERELRELGERAPDRSAELREELGRIEREVREIDANVQRGRRELEGAHMQRRVEELKRQIHELSEAGRHEEAERLKQEGRRMWAEFEERRRREGEGPPPPPPGDVERRLHHLRAAAENLHAAGMHDAAERLMQQAEQFLREHREGGPTGPHRPDPHRPEHPPHPEGMERPPMPEPAMHQVEQLRREVQQMRAEMQELREVIKRLAGREREER